MSLEHHLQLALTNGLGPILLSRLIQAAGSASAACKASPQLLQSIDGIGLAKSTQISRGLHAAAEQVPHQIAFAQQQNVRIICLDDPDYPSLLLAIPDPPTVLFVKGDLQDRDLNGIAIVGSRGCTFYGREQADRFAAALAGSGFTIVSGGARGIDSAAHRGALSHPAGRTIAVLGCGVDQVYPPENTALFEAIAARGAVISEYPLGTLPLPENFPRRNRIISGLSRGVLVIEADERSGALITARCACEDHGRPVFALPGRIDNKMSTGPHRLIRDGAALVTCMQDVIDALDPLPAHVHEPKPDANLFDTNDPETDAPNDGPDAPPDPTLKPAKHSVPLTAQQAQIIDAIADAPTCVDLVAERTTLPIHVILQELTVLSLKGLIRRVDGQTYTCR